MADVFNPYEATSQSVRHQTRSRTTIRDASSDRRFNAGGTSEDTTIDTLGGRTAEVTNEFLRTQDGRIARHDEPVYACSSCRRHALHERVMRTCDHCAGLSCARCVNEIEDDEGVLVLCADCYREWRWQWHFSFGLSTRVTSLS